MSVNAQKAIKFDCEKCGETQYADYTLEQSWEDDRAVMADNIDCCKCGHTNRVIDEL